MLELRRLSIRSKLIAIVVFSTILPLIIGFSIVMVKDIRAFQREMVDNALLIAQVTAENSVTELAFGDRDAAHATLSKLASLPEVRHAFLYDTSGHLFSAFYAKPRADAVAVPLESLTRFVGKEFQVKAPVVYEGERYGTIEIAVSTEALQKKIGERVLMLLMLLALLVGTAMLIGVRLQRLVSEPILELAALAREVSEKHDYSVRAPRVTDDEIGALASGFNEMLTQIARRQRERDEANQRTREKSQFLANMSHELRTPLNAIIGFSEVLRGRVAERLEARELRFLDNINASGQHLLGIVNDILDLSKIEAGHMEINTDTFSVEMSIESVCHLMRGVSSQRGIYFEVEIEPALPMIEADPVKIKQVLYNLLSNAVKFSPERSKVIIRATRDEKRESICISVIDHGVGIDPKDHERIFQEFQQVDGTMARQFGGTGLGLTLVKKFVEMHHGLVEVESALGEGSTFTVTIPIHFGGVKPAHIPTIDEAPDLARRILVIEDDPAAFHTIEQHLMTAGYAPVHARTGEEGIALAQQLQPAAITLDLILPGIDGIEVLKRLKSDALTRGIPVVIVSVVENRELGIAFGARDYLLKPVNAGRLLESLAAILDPMRSGTLLVIDDDRSLHDMIDASVDGAAYSVVHAYGASDGIARAGQDAPSLVILDLMMQEMKGFDVAAQLKGDPRTARLPILAVTNTDLSGGERARLKGKFDALIQRGELSGARLAKVIRELVYDAARPWQEGGG